MKRLPLPQFTLAHSSLLISAALACSPLPSIASPDTVDTAPEIPLVYTQENTGTDIPAPPLPPLDELPTIEALTNPFAWSDGRGQVEDFQDWERRRSEIFAEIQHYETGPKPDRPEDITAGYANGVLQVDITVNGETLSLHATVELPEGDGPFPAIIGIGKGSGSLPADLFSSRGIAQITYNFNEVMSHTQTRGQEPINRLYPDLTYIGAYSAWPWGVSRLIDGLELLQDELPIDLQHLGITGCSFAGKMALFAGAFDERIALTIAQEPGGGGAAAWRVSETLGKVEKLGATNYAWFMQSMAQFSATNVSKLPMDHHELMAMVAPRALLVLGNTDYTWLAEESGYVSCRAAHEVWKNFGIEDRFGFSIVGGHGHCALPDTQRPEVEAFIDKFLLGIDHADTQVTRHPFENVPYELWTAWWGTDEPGFPSDKDAYTLTYEAECATVGSNWTEEEDSGASQGRYITAITGTENTASAPSDSSEVVSIPFSLEQDGEFSIYWRVNCPSASDDSFWYSIDGADFTMANGLGTQGWQWLMISKATLSKGEHEIRIGYREDGALLDKISISTHPFPPAGLGQEAQNACNP